MPRHLYPGYRPSKSVITTAGSSADASQTDEEEEEEGKFGKMFRCFFEYQFVV